MIAINIGMSSLTVKCSYIDLSFQASWNHSVSLHPLQPYVPWCICSYLSLFPICSYNQGRAIPASCKYPPPSQVWPECSIETDMMVRLLATLSSAITCLRKVLPGATTVHACWRIPMSDSNSHLVHDFLCFHSSRRDCSRPSLSSGRRSSRRMVSMVMQGIQLWCLGQLVFLLPIICQVFCRQTTECANSSYTVQN